MTENNLKKILAGSAIVVALSLAYQSYELPKNLKSAIIPTVEDMQYVALQKMQQKTDYLIMMENRIEDIIGGKCFETHTLKPVEKEKC